MYDVIIIGAGPAGGCAALTAAQAGLRTLLLEEHDRVGAPIHCGECLSELALKRMRLSPPADSRSTRVRGIRIAFAQAGFRTLSEPGIVLNKDKFEQWLSRQATAAGAELLLDSRVCRLVRADGGWQVGTSRGEYHGRLVIDASGAASVASKQLGWKRGTEYAVGVQQDLGEMDDEDFISFHLLPDRFPDSYAWHIPKGRGIAKIGVASFQGTRAKSHLTEFIRQFGWDRKPVLARSGGRIPCSGPGRSYADGLLLTGDAAGFASPLFLGGTHLALMGGRLAAETAVQALHAGDCSAAGLAEYERRWRREFPAYRRLIGGRKAIFGLSDQELGDLAALLPSELSSVGLVARLAMGLRILCHPRLFAKGAFQVLDACNLSRAARGGW